MHALVKRHGCRMCEEEIEWQSQSADSQLVTVSGVNFPPFELLNWVRVGSYSSLRKGYALDYYM